MTGKIASVVERSVELAVIAVFIRVFDSVSTFLGGCAVVIALVENKYAIAVHFAVHDIAIVADLTFVYDAIAATTNVDADWLIGSAFLPWVADNIAAYRC